MSLALAIILVRAWVGVAAMLGRVRAPRLAPDEVGDGGSRLRLHSGDDVRVLLKGEHWCRVSQALAHHLHRDASAEPDRGVCMTRVVLVPTSA